MLRQIELRGLAEYKTSVTEGGEMKPYSNRGTEAELILEAVLGMLDYYERSETSVAFEGTVFTPDWVSNLQLANLTVRAAFVGYTDATHVEAMLKHAKNDPSDWLNQWLSDEGGDESTIRAWASKQVTMSKQIQKDAAEHGYPFFDISRYPFDDYKNETLNYFLE